MWTSFNLSNKMIIDKAIY